MSNPFDRFDEAPAENPFDRFDKPPAEPTSNALADATRRVYGESGGAFYDSAGGMARGLRKLGEVLVRAGTTDAAFAYGLPPAEAAQAGREAAATVGDRTGLDASVEENRKLAAFARAQAGADPARDDTLLAKLADGVGSLPVAIASGPAAPVTIAAMMGEQGANDAREKLAARGITDPAEIRRAEDASFVLNAPVGLVSEALLGAPALLRSVRGMTAGTTTAARIARQAGAGAAREGAQEGIEQLAGNIVAKDAVGYDPERERTAGLGEAVLLGSLIGGPTGAAFQSAQELDARKAHREFARDLDTNKNVPESFKTLYLQQDQLLRGLRPAQMFPAGSQELPLPRGMERLETKRGVFHFNPGQIRADALARLSAEGRENEVLGLGPVSKPEVEARARATGEPVVSITERAPDGTEVKTAVGTAGTAATQVAALERSKTPGNTVAVEQPQQTIVERMRAQQEQAAAVIRADQERELAARVERQRVADAKKARIDQALGLARTYAAKPDSTLVELKSVATNIDAALADDSLGLTLEQRQQAAELRKQIAPRLDQLQVIEDAAAAQRVAKMKEDAAAEARAQKETRRIETEALRAIERTGRDPREEGRIVDITKVPDDEFEALQNGLDAEGLDMPTWEREMERRMREREADDGSPNFTLADVFTGANGAKKWIGRTFKIPTAAALREAGDPLAGDMEAIQESLPASWFSSKAGDLDGFAQSLRGYGFEFQTPGELLAALRSPEDYRPSVDLGGADQQVEFATSGREDASRFSVRFSELVDSLVLSDMERPAAREWVRDFAAMPAEDAFNALSEMPLTPATAQTFMRYWQERHPQAATARDEYAATNLRNQLVQEFGGSPSASQAVVRNIPTMSRAAMDDWVGNLKITSGLVRMIEEYWSANSSEARQTPAPVGPETQLAKAEEALVQHLRSGEWRVDIRSIIDTIADAQSVEDVAKQIAPATRPFALAYWRARQRAMQPRPAPMEQMSVDTRPLPVAGTPEADARSRFGYGLRAKGDGTLWLSELFSDGDHSAISVAGDTRQPVAAYNRAVSLMQQTGRPLEMLEPKGYVPPAPPAATEPRARYDYEIRRGADGQYGLFNAADPNESDAIVYFDEYLSPEAAQSRAEDAVFSVEKDAPEYDDLTLPEIRRRIAARIRPLQPAAATSLEPARPTRKAEPAKPDPQLEQAGQFFREVATEERAWQFGREGGPERASKDIAVVAPTFSTPDIVVVGTWSTSSRRGSIQTWNRKPDGSRGSMIGAISFEVDPAGEVRVGATGANSNTGADRGGKNTYQAIFTWAHNNGYRVYGNSLSEVNQVRRTVNMLSSALRHGTTAHLAPYFTQQINGWIDGGPEVLDNNVGAMLRALSVQMSERTKGRLDALTYDAATDSIVDNVNGRRISETDLKRIIETARLHHDGFGPATARAVLAGRSQLAAHSRGQGLDLARARDAARSGSLGRVLYARGEGRGVGEDRPGALRGSQPGQPGVVSAAPLSDAEIARERAAIIQSLGPRVREFDIRVGKLADLLDDEGYHRAAAALRANRFGEADAATQGRMPPARRAEFLRLRAEQNFLLVATREARAGRMTGLVLHELAHHYWNALPEAAKAIYRREAEQATRTRTGPLYDSQGRSRTTILVSAEDLRRAGRGADLAADPDLPAKEYFAELVRIQNADYAANRVAAYSAPTALQRLGRKLMLELRRIWNAIRAGLGNLPRDTDLATAGFREWLSGASQERIDGTAAAFATTQATMDLGGAALGLDLPNTIRNLTPKWQDKTVRFESNLDKALFYAGTEGNSATRTEIIEHLGRETGLSAGQIAGLARDLRRKLAPLARSTVAGGTLRVPAQMQSETRQMTGVNFATSQPSPVLARLDAKRQDLAPTDADKRVAAKWLDVMPAFQGGKYQMAEPAARAIRENFTIAQREQIETVVDYFGGGGMWGGYLALTHFPNAKRLVVYELEPYRADKIQAFMTDGDRFAELLARPDVRAVLREVVAQATADGTTSGSALAARIEDRWTTAPAEMKGVLGALIDAAKSARGRAVDEAGVKTAEATMAKLETIATRDAGDAAKGAKALRERGVEVEVRNENSYASQPVAGDRVLAVMDPPYYLTTGYLGETVGIDLYRQTDQLLRRNATAGNAILYTDAAWHIDSPERFQTQDELITVTPEDHERLGNIVDSLNAVGTVGLENRHELLGINLPGHTEGAAAVDARAAEDRARSGLSRGDGRPARSDRPDRTEERGVASQGGAPGDMADQDPARALQAGDRAEDRGIGTRRDQLKAALPAGVTTGAKLEAEQQEQTARLGEAAKAIRHPAAQGEVEPGDAWAVVTKLTPDQLRAEIRAISQHINEGWLDLSDIEKANALARQTAAQAELDRREPPPAKVAPAPEPAAEVAPAGTPVPTIRKIDRKDALLAAWREGKRIRDEGQRTGNEEAWAEGQKQVTQAKTALDNEYPEWADEANPSRPAPAVVAQNAPTAPAAPTGPAPARAAQVAEDDGRNLPPPAPPTPPENGPPREDAPAPDRGRAREIMGQTAVTPSWWASSWEKARAALVGIRGSIPEIPVFTTLAAKTDRFLRDFGPNFYDGLRAFHRTLASGNDYVQRTAEEQVAAITTPLLRLGGRFDADGYAKLQKRREQKRRLAAENRPMPAGAQAELDALELRLESHPYYLFNRLVVFLDLDWRERNLKDSKGNPILLPFGLNATELDLELKRISAAIVASPHNRAIEDAYQRHVTLVKRIADDLKQRDLLAAEHLANPVYFPHLTLEITRGGKTEQRELRPERVRVGTEADFRGYLQDPVGSTKAIDTDYVRAMYYHLVQVGAHNLKADAIRDHVRGYDMRKQVDERAKQMSREYGRTVSWEEAYHTDYAPQGYVLYGTDSRDAFPMVQVDRDKLARRMGVVLTSEDLHKQLHELGLKGIQLLPDDLRETLVQGQRETWIVPARVAEALRGIADRQTQTDRPIEAALKTVNGWWKAWKLFMPQNHLRYEYGNVVADLEKVFSASPRTFRHLGQAAGELRDFYQGGTPGLDLRAALKDGVINAITAQEMKQLVRLRAFETFQTKGQKVAQQLKNRASSVLFQPITQTLGLGDMSSVELSAFRESVTRYANYLANLDAIRNGARPDYAGAYWRDIEALGDTRPGAGDKAQRQAAQISKATFGDYADLSVTGQYLRDKLIPFYSWMEINFKYHGNLLRNNLDLVRGRGTRAKGGVAIARQSAGLVGGFALRLTLPYVAIALWNAMGPHDVEDDELSEEDRRRIHIRLGHTDDGKAIVVYANTALADVMKWFAGAKFVEGVGAWLRGDTELATAADRWAGSIPTDLANNVANSTGVLGKVTYALAARKSTFPDVTDQRTIPDYDMRRHILAQLTDDFTADQIERIVNKDYAPPKDYADWAMQLVLQMRQRDPESWAFYAMKDKAAEFVETQTGQSRDSSYNAPDQQVLRNFRRALYRGDAAEAGRFYLRLLDLGYTSERFTASIRAQDPLSELPKENGLRRKFVESLDEAGQEQLRRAYRYYTRISTVRGSERGLFPSKESGERGLERYRANPRTDLLDRALDRREQMSPEDEERRIDAELRRSMAGAN
jgi:hypothetical protein